MDLNSKMEFDHVIEVHADGTVTDCSNVYAPELNDGELDSEQEALLRHLDTDHGIDPNTVTPGDEASVHEQDHSKSSRHADDRWIAHSHL